MNRELFCALEFGQVPATFQEFDQRFSHLLDDVTFQGDTPLHIAARKGNLHLVQWILQLKPSLDKSRNKDDNTPLHEAAKSSNLNVVEFFLQREDRSDYLHYNKFRETPLVIASQYGRVEIVERLLVPEARLSEDLFEWDRSLENAAYRGYEGVVVAMLNKIPSLVNIATILRTVVQGGHLECVQAVLNHSSWQIDSMMDSDGCGRCAVHVAAMKGLWNIINEFMTRMPDSVEIRSSDGKSILHFAVEHNQFQLVQNLLSNRTEKYGTEDKAVEMVSRDHDGSGNTALHIAAEKKVDTELLDHLLPYRGDNINVLNDEGKTALDIASEAAQDNPNCVYIVQRLKAEGAIRSGIIPKSSATSSHPSNDAKQGADNDAKQEGDRILNTQLVAASVIATIAFQAMFQIPGGIEDDDKKSIHYGVAKMAFDKAFRLFIFSDTVAFFASLTVVASWYIRLQFPQAYASYLLFQFPALSLLVSIISTVIAFMCATIVIVIPKNLDSLESKNKEAGSKYDSLLVYDMLYPALLPLLIATVCEVLSLAVRLLKLDWRNFSELIPCTRISFPVTYALSYLALLFYVWVSK